MEHLRQGASKKLLQMNQLNLIMNLHPIKKRILITQALMKSENVICNLIYLKYLLF